MERAPIFGFNDARAEIVNDVTGRVVTSTKDPLLTLNDAAYHETKRLETSRRPADREALAEWRQLARSLGKMSEEERRRRLQKLAEHYGWDVAGNFDPRVYKVSTRLLPPVVTALLAPKRIPKLLRTPSKLISPDALADKIVVQGDMSKLQALVERGTAVYVPTHLSNMDSIIVGYALERAGLPPATYGAGKNLFTNPVMSFFMHNLGAYRVDRRLRHALYKDVLKTYSCVLLERGYHSIFFPGGTRSRSGGVERKLKLGLVGSALEAYARTLLAGRERRIFFVPVTINFMITLEAETLIADYLAEAGKGRYIIDDDESSRVGRIATFVRKLLDMEGAVVIRLSDPIDPFGNQVDEHGESYDSRGRRVDPATYVKDASGRVLVDPARDAEYTRQLGDEICRAYLKGTVIMPTHLVATACFEHLRKASPAPDLFTVLRQRDTVIVPRDDLARDVLRIRDRVAEIERAGLIVLPEDVRRASGGDLVERALRAFAGYHSSPAIVSRPEGVLLADTNLLFYYQNRLAAHGVAWDMIAPAGTSPWHYAARATSNGNGGTSGGRPSAPPTSGPMSRPRTASELDGGAR